MDSTKKIDDGGKAFPCHETTTLGEAGMSLRDYFAAKALTGLLVRERIEPRFHEQVDDAGMVYAKAAYAYADAMLAARQPQ